MQEEVNEKTVSLCITGGKVTVRLLKQAMMRFLAAMEKEKVERSRKQQQTKGPPDKEYHGKQSMKKLAQQNVQLSNIEITDNNIKAFEKVAKKYGIDFSLKRDKSVDPPRYFVFFKARDVDVMTAAFREFTGKTLNKAKKPSVRKKLQEAITARSQDKQREREKTKEIEGCSAPKYNVANLHAGCVELFVGKNARLRYSTIENWSKNMYNLNTKRAGRGGRKNRVGFRFIRLPRFLPVPDERAERKRRKDGIYRITFAGKGQNLDTGAKVVHSAPDTSSYINTKSISKDGGISTFRSSVSATKAAKNTKSAVSCQSLMLDDISRSDTIPAMDIRTKDANIGHEAQIGSISDEAVFYLMSRGMTEEDARACIVSGFADDVSKELPLEYAVEMNNLIRLEMKGSIG